MQFASFKNCVEFGVEAEADRLLMTNMITNEQYGMLNFQNLKNFFHSNLWKRISESKVIYREKRFTVKDNSGALLGVGNETVLVQGVIDLFFENPDGSFTVVDYKTDRARPGDERMLSERYKGQLSYYAKAVKEITGKEVNEGIIYSFSLGKEITVDLNQI
jgi:ATP-dependent helicase/nuclease subunit A